MNSGFPYDSPKWKRKRNRILRRDGYRCQESRRYGKAVEATVVHHIYPAEEFPEYAWCDWNLVSLSQPMHNAMHDRGTRALTALGREWMRRVSPPPPGMGPAFSSNGVGRSFQLGGEIG